MGINALVVDDSTVMRRIVKKNLRDTGATFENIFEAGDGLEALEVLSQNRVDVLLSDINMPNMGGIELLKEIRKRYPDNTLKIVMITTDGAQESVDLAKSLGANGYMRKPFKPEQIRIFLSGLL